jgi:predicted unusual protein kinase regulating ubiquinone biosynthesis (AarF/ABC1/UbiB family)
MTSDALRRIDAVIQVGLRLARSAPSGRIVLARTAEAIDLEWVPRPWGDAIAAELAAAYEAAREPLDFPAVERILREAWEAPWANELDELDPEAVAATPSSQVHRGVLDGQPVAVKVLRPGLARSVRQDLALVVGLLAPLGAAFPALDASAVIHEFRERVLEELDLEHEAGVQRRFHRAVGAHPFLVVPAPVTALSHDNVLVSEWIEGVPIAQAPDPDQAAARLVAFASGAVREGMIHADLTPENLLVLGDGRLAVLDFGATRTVHRDRADKLAAAIDAFADGDPDMFGAALEALGAAPARLGATALDLIAHTLGELGGPEPSRLDSAAVVQARDRMLDRPDQLGELILAGDLPPEDLWPARGDLQLFATIARIGATGAWRELVCTALRDGWRAPVR